MGSAASMSMVLLALTAMGALGQNICQYVIQDGDTLSEIASTYGTTYQDLAATNDIPNPDLILAGDTITVPCGDGGSSSGDDYGDYVDYGQYTTPPFVPPPTPANGGEEAPSGSSGGCPDAQSALQKHNEFRASHGAPPLSWSDSLAASAQAHSDQCVFQHGNSGYGENIGQGYADCTSPVESWYAERPLYTGDFSADAGHFSQVVWKGSSEVGCGLADCGGQPLMTCQYNPPGNMQGAFGENVEP